MITKYVYVYHALSSLAPAKTDLFLQFLLSSWTGSFVQTQLTDSH